MIGIHKQLYKYVKNKFRTNTCTLLKISRYVGQTNSLILKKISYKCKHEKEMWTKILKKNTEL